MKNRIGAVAVLAALPLCLAAQEPESVEWPVHGGNPYRTATPSPEDADALLELLHDPAMAPYWTTIATRIGASRRVDMAQPLIEFVHGRIGEADWSLPTYRGRTSAIIALGYLVHDTGSPLAMRYLIDSVNPGIWLDKDKRDVSWLRDREDRDQRSVLLSTAAITALALTGKAEAGKKLEELAASHNGRLRQVAEAALPDWTEINATSLTEYYQRDRGDGSIVAAVGR